MVAKMKENKNLKNQVAMGMIWRFGERICAQGVSFVLSIVLARILMPEDYGMIALLLVFINIANVFVSNGFGEALVQQKAVSDIDYSTVFYCSTFVSIVIYTILFISAPGIARFYNNMSLCMVLRVFSLQIPISAVKSIQQAYIQRNMEFRKFFFSTLGGTIFSGVVGIILAVRGYGVWALVVQYLSNSMIDTTVLFFTVKWRPILAFSTKSAKQLIGYGWKLTAGALINTGYDEVRSLIIGKIYSPSDLAYYNKGIQFPKLIILNMNVALNSVLFPAFSQKGHSNEGVKGILRKTMQVNTYLIFPLMMGMGVVAEPLIRLVLTEKWMSCVPYLQIMCFYYAYVPISTIVCQSIKSIGRSDLYLKMTLYRRILYVAILIIAIDKGVLAIALTNVITVFIAFIINGLYVKKYVGYTFYEQLEDLVPQICLSTVMGIVVYMIGFLNIPDIGLLVLQMLAGAGIYVGASACFKVAVYRYLVDFIKQRKRW